MKLKWKIRGSVYFIRHKESGKGYVGQHNKPDPKLRWKEHRVDANGRSNLPLHNALRKYGVDAFTWEVLIICPLDELTNMEGYYAEVFGTYIWDDSPGGYNAIWCSEGRRTGIINSPEAIEKVRQANLGRKHSAETIEKIRQAKLGTKMSPEAIKKMRESAIGKKKSPEHIENARQGLLNYLAKRKANLPSQ